MVGRIRIRFGERRTDCRAVIIRQCQIQQGAQNIAAQGFFTDGVQYGFVMIKANGVVSYYSIFHSVPPSHPLNESRPDNLKIGRSVSSLRGVSGRVAADHFQLRVEHGQELLTRFNGGGRSA